MEITFYLGYARQIPEAVILFIAQLPDAIPLAETIKFTFIVWPQIPELPWLTTTTLTPWPTFDGLLRLRKVHCCLSLSMDYFHGDASVLYDGFVFTMRNALPGLHAADMLAFSQGAPIDRHLS
jgi:hypothetical protein